MKGEGKGLTDLALLFTAGVAAGLQMDFRHGTAYLTACISFLGAVFFALYQLSALRSTRAGNSIPAGMTPFMLPAAFFFSGLYCACIAALPDSSAAPGQWFIQKAAAASVLQLKAIIQEIPFKDSGSNALVLALLTGDRTALPQDISASFRTSGASHILALSGMHLSVVYIILARMFSVIGNSPRAIRLRSVTTIAAAGFYTMMTGAGASIVRAFLFIALGETARCTGRERPPMNIFCASLMAQAAMTPDELGSPGFQLSYLAMAGIYLIYPPMQKWYAAPDGHRPGPLKKIWDTAAMSIACQITTAPAVWYYFGTFPQYFLITNMIAIPLSSAAINISILVLLARSAGICPDILVAADEFMISAMCRSLEVISTL